MSVIGYIHWNACESCRHYPPETGGCDVDGWDSAQIEGDWVECLRYEPREDAELEETNPNQLSMET